MPEVGIILGSGLGGLAESSVEDAVFNFNELPHFVSSTVAGHAGRLILGRLTRSRLTLRRFIFRRLFLRRLGRRLVRLRLVFAHIQ